ncbi:unnamed protein product [Aphanomyces euteiches]
MDKSKADVAASTTLATTPLDAYNHALRRDRHPRSFGRHDTSNLWNSLKASTARVAHVRIGQGLGSVVDKEEQMTRLDAMPLESPERSEPSRQSFSRATRGKTRDVGSPVDKRRPKKKHHSHEDVIKRIQALGTSETKVQTPRGGASTNVAANDIDTAKLRNDFSSQSTARIYYGSTVAFELFNGDMMTVAVADSSVVVRPLEHIKYQAKGARDKVLFTLINLHELRSANPIKYGDSVWLQLSVGTGETSWEQGGVLGAQVRKAPELNALSLTHKKPPANAVTADDNAPELLSNVGLPVPIRAYLPKTRDETTDAQIDDMQGRLRNKSSRMLGRWIIRPAVANPNAKDNYVYNNHEIYLEQDWFYLGADVDPTMKGHVAVLRQLPSPKTYKPGEYIVERRTAWRLRLVDSSSGGLGLTHVQQQMERLLFKAKTQLKASERMRDGDVRIYSNNIHGGQQFAQQLRQHIQHVTAACDQAYLGQQQHRLEHLSEYFESKIAAMGSSSLASRGNKLSPLAKHQGLRETPMLHAAQSMPLLSTPPLSSSPVSSSSPCLTTSSSPHHTTVCNLCVANRFNLCSHGHDVARLLSTGAPLLMAKSASERALLASSEQSARAKQKEAADLRERDRIMRMLSEQDARLVSVIKTTEHQSAMAAIQRRTELDDGGDTAFYFTTNKRASRPSDGLPDIDELRRHLTEATVPHEEEVEGEEVVEGESDDEDDVAESSDSDDDFITEDEIQSLDYINVNKASALYANDDKAFFEMLTGFAELAQQRIVPQLKEAMASHNKACLLETADFLARAAEFVVARRIQVHVMGLIQSVATSNVDDFAGIGPMLDKLIQEVEGTIHYAETFKAEMETRTADAMALDASVNVSV